MPTASDMRANLDSIPAVLPQDPGLVANTSAADIADGQDAANLMNDVLVEALVATGVNDDGIISTGDMYKISKFVRANDQLYADFVEGHGDDEGNEETGFHLVQGDGGTLKFQGRAFVDTVADAIYHYGFRIQDGRFRNEDGDANELASDVAGWLNYFLNGTNVVWGSSDSETLHSGTYSDVLADAAEEVFYARAGDDKIWAGDGDDTVYAGKGNDISAGGDGNDTLKGHAGDDKLWGQNGNDMIYGGSGNDKVGGDTGDDQLSGGAGQDEVWGGAGADMLSGGSGDDVLGGGSGNDVADGGSGNDKVWGNGGDDELRGGAGDDKIGGDDGADQLFGGSGADKLYGGSGADIIEGGSGADEAIGGDGADLIKGDGGADKLYGLDGADDIAGGNGADLIFGGDGRDMITGDAGHDTLYGQDGNDTLYGGAGRDEISGGAGQDVFVGGAGADVFKAWEGQAARDTFVFAVGDTGAGKSNHDTIAGFQSGVDKIDLKAFDGLSWIDVDAFAGAGAGQVRFADKMVEIDHDGNGKADHLIAITNLNELAVGDFVL